MKAIAKTALVNDGPKTAANIIANKRAGKANPMSATRITRSSTQPPIAEASRPSRVPIEPPNNTATNATIIEFLDAAINCDNTSRPN